MGHKPYSRGKLTEIRAFFITEYYEIYEAPPKYKLPLDPLVWCSNIKPRGLLWDYIIYYNRVLWKITVVKFPCPALHCPGQHPTSPPLFWHVPLHPSTGKRWIPTSGDGYQGGGFDGLRGLRGVHTATILQVRTFLTGEKLSKKWWVGKSWIGTTRGFFFFLSANS